MSKKRNENKKLWSKERKGNYAKTRAASSERGMLAIYALVARGIS